MLGDVNPFVNRVQLCFSHTFMEDVWLEVGFANCLIGDGLYSLEP